MIFKKQKLMLGITTLLLSASSAYSQYNVDHLVGPYENNQVLTSITEVGADEVVSVGTITTSEPGEGTHKDILITKTGLTGNIIWSYRYGQPDQAETGYGVTLSWDGKHVIVVGSMYYSGPTGVGSQLIPLRDAITLKVRISDGALIWTTTHGTFSNDEEALLIERTNDGIIGDKSYVVVGHSTGDAAQSFRRMYAFKLNESGGEVWSKRYLLTYNFPFNAVTPSSMVKNGYSKLMIAGIQSEINKPTQPFTTGISTVDGSITDDYTIHSITSVYNVKDCAIARDADGSGFALAFTADYFFGNCLSTSNDPVLNTTDRIGVIRLNPSRKAIWTDVYWQPQEDNQIAVAIDIKGGVYNVATSFTNNNIWTNVESPGFLRINKTTSFVIDCHIYHSSFNPLGVIANCMIRAKDGDYIMKTFVHPNNGFSLIKLNDLGISSCDESVQIVRCKTSTKGYAKKSSATNYGSVALNYSPRHTVGVGSYPCYDPFGTKSISAPMEETQTSKMIVYPSPLGAEEEIVNIKFTTDLDDVSAIVHVYNAMGQEVLSYDLALKEGENTTSFNAQKLSSGMHTIVIDTDTEILDRGKLLKQ